jgi:hypothetical protein
MKLRHEKTDHTLTLNRADGEKVMTATREADGNTADSVVPYTTNPITLSPIPEGTFVNDTHVSSTFLCSGCINSDSFDPAWADETNRDVFFGYAFSQIAVESPSDINTTLSDHSGQGAGYGAFKMDLNNAKSDDYDKYAAMAEQDSGGADSEQPSASSTSSQSETPTPTVEATPSLTTETPAATTTDDQGWRDNCWESECDMPSGTDYSYRDMSHAEFFALLAVGVVYLMQAFIS